MATELKITGFHDAVDYKIVQCTAIESADHQVNVTVGPGTLYAAYLDSSNCSANVSLHILDGKETTNTEFVLRGLAQSTRSIQVPTGFAFSELEFWVSANSAEADSTSFTGTVDVTLICI
jgi:hypothetical protein